MEMTGSRWVWLFVIIFISSILIFVLNDREKKPDMILPEGMNKTTTNSMTETEINSLKIPQCGEDYNYIPEKNICYKENPFGHTIMTFTQILAVIFTIGLITVYEFKDWRIYLSSKLLPYRNKYQDYITPITKSPDTYEKKGFLWARAGFDALMSGSSNEIYIAKKEYTAKVAHNIILKGAIQKVSQQYLYEYTGKDLNLLKEIVENPIIWVNKKGKLQDIDNTLIIYLTLPIKHNQELKGYSSISGFFGFGADRFDLVMAALFKMKQGLIGFGMKLNKANESMLDNARRMSQSTAVIADAVGKTQDAEIQSYRPSSQDNNSRQQDSENMRRQL